MKKILCYFLALIMIFSASPLVYADGPSFSNFIVKETYADGQFVDVAKDIWYADSVQTAYELGLVKGSSANTFSPTGKISIAETLAFASRLHNIYHANNADFTQQTPWYQVYVDYCVMNGIINEGEYPDYSVSATRAQFSSILSKALPTEAFASLNDVPMGAIPDVPKTATYAEAVYLLYRAGILTGNDIHGTFSPDSMIQRCEVAAIVTRMAVPSHRKQFTLEPTVKPLVTLDDLQGIWYCDDNGSRSEYIVTGNQYIYAKYYYSEALTDGIPMCLYKVGTFTLDPYSRTSEEDEFMDMYFTGEYHSLWKDYEVKTLTNHRESVTSLPSPFLGKYQKVSSSTVLDVVLGTIEAFQNGEEYVPPKPVINSSDYAYLAGNDFRSIRRTYSTAKGNHAYVYAYEDLNGDRCVMTYISYKIISNYDAWILHNLTTGETINDPVDYYDACADYWYGAKKNMYMDLTIEAIDVQIKVLEAVTQILKSGQNTTTGVFVNADRLNK